ncbi:Putative tartrate transporter [Aquisphaera giovannonii]|uniref:Tartrate transporter n=1 Tax=Aquisphaera giovannonii TaxID=406548 RepID=A0A5B9WF84_9BACT|nr:MFS transporter [Aquisphaera giovannonii]QEH39207.1 Putative tartrate transporter [Aquisphaera giovannonii]
MRLLDSPDPLDRARGKAYLRLLPLLFLGYVIAYVDRTNVSIAKLDMQKDLGALGFSDEGAFGFGMGIFFVGYLLLEIPGTLAVERWSARKWFCRIMVSWGLIAAMTAFVHYDVPFATAAAGWLARAMASACGAVGMDKVAADLRGPGAPYILQFWGVRFLLGLAEAGFYPGVIVYLTHWFPRRDRSRTLAWFFIGGPISQILGPPICARIMAIGPAGASAPLGLAGWQWVFIAWGVPAVVLGLIILLTLPDWPRHARWLTDEERTALEDELARERKDHAARGGHVSILRAFAHPKILALAAAYFFVVTGNYGVEFYMATIVKEWYQLDVGKVAYLVIIPPLGSVLGQILVGWSSDRTGERRWHAALPILLGAAALALTPATRGTLWLTVLLFTCALTGLKAYMPAFWSLPSLLVTEAAAAVGIGLINSFGNLGGWVGPTILGVLKKETDSFRVGLWVLASSMVISAMVIIALNVGRRVEDPEPAPDLAELA